MKIITKSGAVTINKRTPYGKWLIGYVSTNAWTGWYTLECTWNKQKDNKPKGCSWIAWGVICGNVINPLHDQINDLLEECGRL